MGEVILKVNSEEIEWYLTLSFGYHFVDPDMRFFGKGPGSPEIGCLSSI